MEGFESNSYKSRALEQKKPDPTNEPVHEKRVDKVVSGKVTTKKKSEFSKFKDDFVANELPALKEYIFKDVIIQSLKKSVYDIITNGIDIILYGETGHSKKKSNSSSISYRSYYDGGSTYREREPRRAVQTSYNYDDVIIESRGEAERVLTCLEEATDQYDGVVSVADFYDLVGVTTNYTDNNYGWSGTDIRSAKVVRTRDGGYMIQLPKAFPLK